MNVKCPICKVTVLLSPKRASGSLYTYQGVRVKGELDSDTGIARQSNVGRALEAFYELKSYSYQISECPSCGDDFISEDGEPIWPLSGITIAEEIPEKVATVFSEAKLSHAVGAETAALLAARTALSRCQREQNVSKIKDLADQGKITSLLYQQADELRLWANITGHDEIEIDAMEALDVEQLLEYLDMFFDAIYVHPAKLKAMRDRRNNIK